MSRQSMNQFLFILFTLLISPRAYSFANISTNIGNRNALKSSNGNSNIPMKMSSTSSSSSIRNGHIAVVGCGVLGSSLCKQLLSSPDFEGVSVTGITKTTNNHESIREKVTTSDSTSASSSSFHLSTFDDIPKEKQFTNVVFCAPPSGFENYPSAVQNVIDTLWSGPENGGAFVFTSSGGIYGPGNGETVSETTPIPTPESPRTKRLVEAELNTIAAGGCVLRLAGLYTLERGAHNYWLEKGDGTVKGSQDGIINLLHYDDAAGSCVAALQADREQTRGKTFLISDGNPTTRGGICESSLKSKKYGSKSMPIFGGDNSAGKGKIYDGHWSNDVLSWKPVYSSFDEFMINSQ